MKVQQTSFIKQIFLCAYLTVEQLCQMSFENTT